MAENGFLVSRSDYEEKFDTSAFLRRYEWNIANANPAGVRREKHMLRCYHNALQSLPSSSDVKVLDYGSGPVILGAISAAKNASEIVLSDYTNQNRSALQQWLDGDSAAFDWSPHFRFVVRNLEGKGEQEVAERQKLVRKLVKAVVHCDITQDPPIERGYDRLYDVVTCSLVLEGASRNIDGYASNASKLGKLVKPGGLILIYGVENKRGYYDIGDRKFPNVYITPEFAVQTFKDAGFYNISLDKLLPSDFPHLYFWFMKCTRNI